LRFGTAGFATSCHRLGSLDEHEKAVEVEYPTDRTGSLMRFFAATYTPGRA